MGWIVFWGFIFALLNFFVKQINKQLIVPASKKNKKIGEIYRPIMKFVIRFHKPVGAFVSITIFLHLFLMYTYAGPSLTGFVGMSIMLSVFLLGIYGTFFKKNIRGSWLKIHRVLAFLLLISISAHLLMPY